MLESNLCRFKFNTWSLTLPGYLQYGRTKQSSPSHLPSLSRPSLIYSLPPYPPIFPSSPQILSLLLRFSLFSWGFPSSPEVFPLLLRYSSSPEVFPLLLRFSLFSWGFPSSPEAFPLLLRYSLFSWGFPSSPEVFPLLLRYSLTLSQCYSFLPEVLIHPWDIITPPPKVLPPQCPFYG